MEIMKGALVSAYEDTFDARFALSSLTDFEASLVKKLVDERYSRKEWNLKL